MCCQFVSITCFFLSFARALHNRFGSMENCLLALNDLLLPYLETQSHKAVYHYAENDLLDTIKAYTTSFERHSHLHQHIKSMTRRHNHVDDMHSRMILFNFFMDNRLIYSTTDNRNWLNHSTIHRSSIWCTRGLNIHRRIREMRNNPNQRICHFWFCSFSVLCKSPLMNNINWSKRELLLQLSERETSFHGYVWLVHLSLGEICTSRKIKTHLCLGLSACVLKICFFSRWCIVSADYQ